MCSSCVFFWYISSMDLVPSSLRCVGAAAALAWVESHCTASLDAGRLRLLHRQARRVLRAPTRALRLQQRAATSGSTIATACAFSASATLSVFSKGRSPGASLARPYLT
jgi:hypothetical protein